MSNFLDTIFMIDSKVVDFIDYALVQKQGAAICMAILAGVMF